MPASPHQSAMTHEKTIILLLNLLPPRWNKQRVETAFGCGVTVVLTCRAGAACRAGLLCRAVAWAVVPGCRLGCRADQLECCTFQY